MSDKGVERVLVIPTDRRTYHLELLSTQADYIHHVTFLYSGTPAVTSAPKPQPTPVSRPVVDRGRIRRAGRGCG